MELFPRLEGVENVWLDVSNRLHGVRLPDWVVPALILGVGRLSGR
jgi:hypothetical protein